MLADGNATNIIDDELGEIKAELIDNISNEINRQYESLLQFDDNNGTEN